MKGKVQLELKLDERDIKKERVLQTHDQLAEALGRCKTHYYTG